MIRKHFHITERNFARMMALSKRLGIGFSELVRNAIEQFLNKQERIEK
jgi:predicted DNA-binding protein